MNFDLTDEQKMLVSAVGKFVKNESNVERFRKARTTAAVWDKAVWKKMGDNGWMGVAFSEADGGFGGSFVDAALILEQLGRGLVPEPYIASVILGGEAIASAGTKEQKEKFLAPMIEGATSLALAYTENQSRYNLNDCLTKAEKSGSGWKITGEKRWVLNGHAADQIVVAARTSGGQFDADGLSLFIVDGNAAGLERTAVSGMDGHKTGWLKLKGVEVGADRLLGGAGKALPVLERLVDRAAAAACAESQGCLQELFERTVLYLKQREQFGRPIGSFQVLQHRAADMFAQVELCKSMMILAAIKADETDETERKEQISAAKAYLTEGGWVVQKQAIQLHGGIGITDEQDAGLFFKRVRVLQGLFGDADYHVSRFSKLASFERSLKSA